MLKLVLITPVPCCSFRTRQGAINHKCIPVTLSALDLRRNECVDYRPRPTTDPVPVSVYRTGVLGPTE